MKTHDKLIDVINEITATLLHLINEVRTIIYDVDIQKIYKQTTK